MINVGLYYSVKRGHEKEFEGYFAKVIEALKTAGGGFLSGKLYKEVFNDGEYMIYTEWESIGAFESFVASHDFHEATEFGKTILEGRPRHRIFTSA
ncbi:MAG: antibiotic biosynthesis monooxygenase [Candidatus Marsarchaeota archaeon]|jgi:heme-degrading monooxygenase HmoA|nr:antibiotic biosynthesis monooxygenase [Candidatus Marsarchaeota archaeon]